MSIQRAALNTVAEVFVEDTIWAHIKGLVAAIENTDPDLTGQEKRAKVYEEALLIAGDIFRPLVHMLIEMAVVYLKKA